MVRYIRQQYGDYFCIGVAAYPEGHVDSQDKTKDVLYLKEKIDAGADFVVTQLFYDIDTYVKWHKQCRDAGISVPIITGVMPIQSHQAFRRIINLCNTNVPPTILEELNEIKVSDLITSKHLSKECISNCFLKKMVNRLMIKLSRTME